jgi:protein O-mannosyl-transferase
MHRSSSKKTRHSDRKAAGGKSAATPSFGPKEWLFVAALAIAVFLVYQPAWHGAFLWDDESHLLNNPVLRPGGLAVVWRPGGYINYWPLTFTAYWLEHNLWGLNPLGYHLVNIALHAINAILVWRMLTLLKIPGAMVAAAIFALHPVNVESVAWVSQTKNLLSLLFAILALMFHVQFQQRGERWRYVLALAMFLLSTLSKGMVITLPAVLLACDWWRQGRITRQDIVRVLPYLLIGAIMAGIEVWTQHLVASDDVIRTDGIFSRAAVAGCAVWFYFWKMIWPLDVCFIYPRWELDPRAILSYMPGVLLVVLLAISWRFRQSWGRPLAMLLVCYVALLFPVLGFANIYFMRYSFVADHWQYAASIVPCAAIVGMAASSAGSRRLGIAACMVVLPTLAILSWRQSCMYGDVEMLYRTTIEQNPKCWLAHNNLGAELLNRNQTDEAAVYFQKSLELKPDFDLANSNFGKVLAGRGQYDKAIAYFRKTLEIKPNDVQARNNLGAALDMCGQTDEAIVHYQKALEIKPDSLESHSNLGMALADRGRIDEAVVHFRKALDLAAQQNKPDMVESLKAKIRLYGPKATDRRPPSGTSE